MIDNTLFIKQVSETLPSLKGSLTDAKLSMLGTLEESIFKSGYYLGNNGNTKYEDTEFNYESKLQTINTTLKGLLLEELSKKNKNKQVRLLEGIDLSNDSQDILNRAKTILYEYSLRPYLFNKAMGIILIIFSILLLIADVPIYIFTYKELFNIGDSETVRLIFVSFLAVGTTASSIIVKILYDKYFNKKINFSGKPDPSNANDLRHTKWVNLGAFILWTIGIIALGVSRAFNEMSINNINLEDKNQVYIWFAFGLAIVSLSLSLPIIAGMSIAIGTKYISNNSLLKSASKLNILFCAYYEVLIKDDELKNLNNDFKHIHKDAFNQGRMDKFNNFIDMPTYKKIELWRNIQVSKHLHGKEFIPDVYKEGNDLDRELNKLFKIS